MSDPLSVPLPLVFEVEAQGKAPAIIHHIQQLLGEAAMGAVGGVVQVQRREVDVELFPVMS